MTKVAIYLLSFNRPNFILATINSILNQTFQDFKLYILDNSQGLPKPMVKEKLQTLTDPKIKIFYEDNFMHVGEAYYRLSVELSDKDEEYSLFYADDSIMHPKKLEILVDFMDKHSEADMAGGQLCLDGTFEKQGWDGTPGPGGFGEISCASCQFNFIQPLIRRKIIDTIGKWRTVETNSPQIADSTYWLQVSEKGFTKIYGAAALGINFCLDANYKGTYGYPQKWSQMMDAIRNSGSLEMQLFEGGQPAGH